MSTLDTYFAPAERADDQAIAVDYRMLSAEPLIAELLNAFPEPAAVLNAQRQVVFANDKLIAALNRPVSQVIGFRPGELLNCIHAHEQNAGCGTSHFCSQCGAVRAIVGCAVKGQAQVEECRITSSSDGGLHALDLRVWGTPLASHAGFTVFAIRDITDEKRRAVLERLFFHDLLNAAGGLRGIMEMWPDLSREETDQMSSVAKNLAEQLVEEIRAHRDLVAAERGDLAITLKTFDVAPLLSRFHVSYGTHALAEGKHLTLPETAGPTLIYSDEVLLGRVLGNLLKNALEASATGDSVHLSFDGSDEPTLSVHNRGCMPANVQLQVFQRSFSTKSPAGRGLGTYSVKLLTEQYLHGTVRFTSYETTGTTFTLTLPRNPR